jgi:hypothetical protein
MKTLIFICALTLAHAQDAPVQMPVQMLVTVEARHGAELPNVTQADVIVHQGKERLSVSGWTAVPSLELIVLIDDDANSDIATQYGDLRNFIAALPSTAKIGIEYMHNGTNEIAQPLTSDRAAAAKSLHIPLGPASGGASPYMSLQDLVKHWAPDNARREVLMISSGIDPYYPVGPENPYLATAIAEAQKAGIVVHSIYYGAGGHLGHSFGRATWGQSYLSMLGDQTGGEAYWEGFGTPVSFQPYLRDLTTRLSHQYLLTFLAQPGKKAELRPVKLSTEVPGAELVSADQAYVPGDR